ncbi:MAG: glutaredoxin domain-containing protein [Clostridia bacterium]
MADITVYGTSWCPDCHRSKAVLGSYGIGFEWIDIDEDKAGLDFVQSIQNGGRTIPMIVFSDGSYLFEPSDEELANKLGFTLNA